MAVNVDILNVNELYINGVNLLEGKRDYIQLVGDEKVVINVPTGSTTYSKAIPQSGVNLGDVELKAIPLDLGTLDDINDGGGLGVDSTYKNVDSSGVSYFSNVNIDNFLINKVRTIKSVDYTTYKWTDVDYGNYSLALGCESLSEISSNGLVEYGTEINKPTLLTTANKKFGSSSLNYTSGSDFLSITDSSIMYFGTGDFTVEMYGYITTTGNFTLFDDKGYVNNFSLRYYNSLIQFARTGGGPIISEPFTFNLSEWYHFALVKYSGLLSIYINGKVVGSVSDNWPLTDITGINIGSAGGNWYGKAFNGYIDEFIISKGIARYTSEFTPLTTPHIIDSYTTLYIDAENNTFNRVKSIKPNTTEKQFGTSSLQFNGTSYITVPSNTKYAFGTDDFTIELGAKVTYLDATYGTVLLENRPDSTNGTYWALGVTKDGIIRFSANTGTWFLESTTTHFNKWVNIVVTRKDGVMNLYINGIKEASTSTIVNFQRDTFNIGRLAFQNNSGALLQGFIDDLRITKGLARYTENFTPSADLMTGTRPVKHIVHSGTAIDSELKFSDYLVSYNAQIDPWVAVVPTITTTTSPFTLIETSALTSNTFTTTQSFNIGDVVSSDMETFGTVIFKEQDEYMVDADIFYDGVQEKVLEKSDVNKINFVQDKRSGVYTNGLKDALLSATSSTIYGHINDEIIVDAGEGGHFNIGTMYTMGGYNDTDTTSQFNISVSDDGITYTVIYENLENLMNNHSHTMTGTGRFIKITFLNEIGTWGRIITNFVDGKWWDLSIVHPQSKVYIYSTKLEVNGKSIVPNYIEWFDNMTINKIVCGKVFINPTTVLNIKTENISKVELDLWKEVKGVL